MAKLIDLEKKAINTVRIISAEAITKANSGHPGMPLGAAPMAHVLWTRFLKHNPSNPDWVDRDRFVLSAGHGSMLLYSLLHLTGYDLSLQEIKNFRQWGSKTPGHPEYGLAPGVELTTGPLGQGFSMGVGMAVAERMLAAKYNQGGLPLIDHHTYAICSDGDIMEGVSSEAASIAGNLKLGKIVYLYDDNQITIEGNTSLTFTEDVTKRFEAYGWQVLSVEDGNDLESIEKTIQQAKEKREKPSLIRIKTHIGYGSPKQDDASVHGAPLSEEELLETKKKLGMPEEKFYISDEIKLFYRQAVEEGKKKENEWRKMFEEYKKKYPEKAKEFERDISGELPEDWDAEIPSFSEDDAPMATRVASGKVIDALANRVSNLMGGSADLAPSTKTYMEGYGDQSAGCPANRNFHFGVREHAMAAIVNGIALHGGFFPFGATFLVFSDYLRPALRLSALMNAPVKFVFTHDSIGVGEDGPTHQPVAQIASLRAMPNVTVFRPADANETAAAWRIAMEIDGPVAFALTRQKLPVFENPDIEEGVRKGAYIFADCEGTPDLIIMASGSEVAPSLEAKEKLESEGINARVVSMPSFELFEEQPSGYQEKVFPPEIKARIAVEAGASFGWARWVGLEGKVIGFDRFGVSANGELVMEKFGFTAENIAKEAIELTIDA